MAKQARSRPRKVLIPRRSENPPWAVWHPPERNWHTSRRAERREGMEEARGRRSERLWNSSLADSNPSRCDLVLPQQDIRGVAQLMTVLHERPRQLAGLSRPTAHVRGKHRAVVEMRAKAVGQISATIRTPGQLRFELAPPVAARARSAVGDRVIPAIGVKKRALIEGQRAGLVAVEMEQENAVGDDRMIRRDDPKAPRTRRVHLLHDDTDSAAARACPSGSSRGSRRVNT